MRPFILSALIAPALLFPATAVHAAGLDTLVGEFQADRRDLNAGTAVPWHEPTLKREAALLEAWTERLEALDYERLDAVARVDWHLLRNQVEERKADLRLAGKQLGEMQPVLAFALPLQELLQARAQRKLVNAQTAAETLDRTVTELKALRKTLEEARKKPEAPLHLSPVVALRAAGAIEELRPGLAAWFSLYDGFQPEFSWWVKKPYQALTEEMTGLAGWLRRDVAGIKGGADDPLVGDPIGREALASALETEMISYTAGELIQLAEREFAWCEAEMKKAATEMGCATAAEALQKAKDNHVAPGGQAAASLAVAVQASRFVQEKNLVTVPPLAEETWGLAMLGPEQQKSLPYAVYGQPRMLVAYAHQDMGHQDKLMSMRGNSAAFLHIVTPHELIPGHHLQMFMARRHATWRAPFNTPFLVEGWALHWEMLLWDQGYLATPEQRTGALFWRMHRCARVIVSLKFHLGEMTPAEMTDFLVDRVGHERAGATAEVRRYIGGSYGPLYQAAYMTGGLQIRAMMKELTAPGAGNEGATGKMSLRDFHDGILRQGPVPIEMVRAGLKGESLPKNWKPAWKFGG